MLDVLQDVDVTLGDVRDFDAVREICGGADAIFHLAALIGIPYSYAHPQEVIDTNIMGTSNVLLAAKELGSLERIVLTSTSEVYGSAIRVPMDEDHPLQAGVSGLVAVAGGRQQAGVQLLRRLALEGHAGQEPHVAVSGVGAGAGQPVRPRRGDGPD